MKIIRKIAALIIPFVVAASTTGCFLEPEFYSIGDDWEGYEVFSDYDIRELEEQISSYWSFCEENAAVQEAVQEQAMQEAEEWETDWVTEGTYTIGQDIAEGLYIAWGEGRVVVRYSDKEWGWDYGGDSYNTLYYLPLSAGDFVIVPSGVKMAPAEDGSPSLSAKENGIYYGGSYKVGEDMPEGEYFAIDAGFMSLIVDDGRHIPIEGTRFIYVTIEDIDILNVKDCVLFPIDNKPEITPIEYQGTGEGEGCFVYPNGMYKVGVDLPAGTYKIKNELFPAVTDLSYEGYHGNASYYYAAEENWCGLEITSNSYYDYEDILWDDEQKWEIIELDNRVNEKRRKIKIRDVADSNEVSYKRFKGLPTITFTEEDIGSYVRVRHCILIPQKEQE